MLKISDLFDLEQTMAGEYLAGFTYPWEALAGIKTMILELGAGLGEDYRLIGENVWAHASAKIAPTASISGPCIIGAGT